MRFYNRIFWTTELTNEVRIWKNWVTGTVITVVHPRENKNESFKYIIEREKAIDKQILLNEFKRPFEPKYKITKVKIQDISGPAEYHYLIEESFFYRYKSFDGSLTNEDIIYKAKHKI
jgi:hypothetical protein